MKKSTVVWQRSGQGLVIILLWGSGHIGGWCAMQVSASGMCECAAVVLAVDVSLRRRPSIKYKASLGNKMMTV